MATASRQAVVILHEIYGINAHIRHVREEWQGRGFDVFTPALFPHTTPFTHAEQEMAYRYFTQQVGFDPAPVVSLLSTLRAQYTTLIVVGYSVGATLAWLAARSGLCDGVICHYGSRIRQHCDAAPPCPALILIARHEPAFDTSVLQQTLAAFPLVQCDMFDAHHGFCDAESATFDEGMARRARERVWEFVGSICVWKGARPEA